MVRRARLDAELVRRGLARSREHARTLIETGRVTVGGQPATKAATAVGIDAAVALAAADRTEPAYASRGAHKLIGALDAFDAAGLIVRGRRCLDAGASTGGFTDVLLRRGAEHVIAVDVGYGQLAWSLRSNPAVTVLERTNVRALEFAAIDEAVELVVADLSFISLALVLPALRGLAVPDADFVLMVKPQFEVGKGKVGSGGVVRDPELRAEAIRSVAAAGVEVRLGVAGVAASPLPGPSGNVEYFLWLRAAADPLREEVLAKAIAEGPA